MNLEAIIYIKLWVPLFSDPIDYIPGVPREIGQNLRRNNGLLLDQVSFTVVTVLKTFMGFC
jgi:hypothetical protein